MEPNCPRNWLDKGDGTTSLLQRKVLSWPAQKRVAGFWARLPEPPFGHTYNTGKTARVKYRGSSDLPRCNFHAHPRMNTALELGCRSTRQGRISGCWTHRRRTRPYEYVGRARGLGDKPTEGNRSAFWRRDR